MGKNPLNTIGVLGLLAALQPYDQYPHGYNRTPRKKKEPHPNRKKNKAARAARKKHRG